MKALLTLAVALTVLPAAHAATSSPAPSGDTLRTTTTLLADAARPELRARVERLTGRARAHSRRLGLSPASIAGPPAKPRLLARRAKRLDTVVDFLAQRSEVDKPVDQRARRAPRPSGRTLGARVARQHSLAVRRSLALGVDRPAPLRLAASRRGRISQLAHWRTVARFMKARTERVRPDERPLSERIPHYEALMCIARHEAGPEHGGWRANTGNGYYGRLQMDRSFQRTYAPRLYRAKGTADNWTKEEQLRTAARAVATRGFHPWPNTARTCGLI